MVAGNGFIQFASALERKAKIVMCSSIVGESPQNLLVAMLRFLQPSSIVMQEGKGESVSLMNVFPSVHE